MVELLPRAANDSIRPLSVIEIALRVRPALALAGGPTAWRLDPQYERWARLHFPSATLHYCPLATYDALVRGADAPHTMESVDAMLLSQAQASGGYTLPAKAKGMPATAMFAVGSTRISALVEFLFRWS